MGKSDRLAYKVAERWDRFWGRMTQAERDAAHKRMLARISSGGYDGHGGDPERYSSYSDAALWDAYVKGEPGAEAALINRALK